MLAETKEGERLEVALSIIVPIRNEGENVITLARRVADALEGVSYELIFADDSDDDTPRHIMALARADGHVRCLHREEPERAGGVATAVVAGIRQSSGAYVAVLRGNSQHPPELLPKLLVAAEQADIAVFSRYIPEGGRKDLQGDSQKLSSRAARTIARMLFRRVRSCSDPLSGFFVFRRDVVQRVKLRPVGTALLLEILVRGKWSRLIEVPYPAARRKRQPVKGGAEEKMLYLQHLLALVFQGTWGHGPVQYSRVDEETMIPSLNSPTALEHNTSGGADQLPGVSPPSWRRIAVQALGMWLVSRVLLALLTYYSALFQANLTSKNPVVTPDLLLGRWDQWDAYNYIYIAHYGYNEQVLTAFFPLYPFLTHLLAFVIGSGNELLAGMIISNLAALVAFVGLGCLVAQEGGTTRTIGQTILVLAAYPFAFFLAAAYTEALFLACAVWALYAARRGWWYLGIGCMLLGALCRSSAVILVLPLMYEFGRRNGWWQGLVAKARQRNWRLLSRWSWSQAFTLLAIAVTVPLAFGVFALVCELTFGDPLLFVKEQAHWNRIQLPVWTALERGFLWQGAILFLHKGFWSYENARNLIDLAPAIIIGIITLCSIRRIPISFTLYMLGLLYITIDLPVHIGQNTVEFDSAGRFLLLSVPIFILFGRWSARYAWVEMLLVGGGFLLQAVFAAYFLSGGWLI